MATRQPKQATKPWVVSSLDLVAEFFGVRRDTIWKEWRAAGMPGKAGAYDLQAILQWKLGRKRDPDRQASQQLSTQDTAERRRQAELEIAEEKAKQLRLQNAQTERSLWDRHEVGRDVTAWAAKLRRRLTSLAPDIATIVPGELKPVISKQVEDRVRIALKEAFESEICDEMVADLILSEAERLRSKQ